MIKFVITIILLRLYFLCMFTVLQIASTLWSKLSLYSIIGYYNSVYVTGLFPYVLCNMAFDTFY